MKRSTLFAIAMVLFVGVFAVGPTLKTSPRKSVMTVQIDSLKAIDEGMRVYCRVLGRPNTSGRIDAVTINGVADAIDIDPIEFKRAFQWEEEGVIALEIDFPVKPVRNFTLRFQTPTGAVTSSYPAK